MEKDLDRLSNPRDTVFKPIHALRDTHKADIVHLIIKAKPQQRLRYRLAQSRPASGARLLGERLPVRHAELQRGA